VTELTQTPDGGETKGLGMGTVAIKKDPGAEEVKGIAHKLALASKEIGAVGKWGQNQHQRYNFRGIEHVINAVHPVFSRLGIVIKVKVLDWQYEVATTSKGAGQIRVRLLVEYTFIDGESGDELSATVPAESFDTSDKATSKAISVALRTALTQVLYIPTMEVDRDYSHITVDGVDHSEVDSKPDKPADLSEEFITRVMGITDLEVLRNDYMNLEQKLREDPRVMRLYKDCKDRLEGKADAG
jgi:gp60